jgi:hypothetical protein
MMNTTAYHATSPAARLPAHKATMSDIADANFADESVDLNCIRGLVSNAERSAQLVDDGMNATEASEERNAVSEAQAMR